MIVFDIETYRDDSEGAMPLLKSKVSNISAPSNYKQEDAIKKYIAKETVKRYEKFALSPLTGKIIVIGILVQKVPEDVKQFLNGLGNEDNTPITEQDVDGTKVYEIILTESIMTEKDMLKYFWEIVAFNMLLGAILVSYNGKAFDLPFIAHRSALYGLTRPSGIPPMTELTSKYRWSRHVDLYNYFDAGAMVEWAFRFGITDSIARDNQKIASWYEEKQMNLIVEKNIMDLWQLFYLYRKVEKWV